jgi:LysM repeat protein
MSTVENNPVYYIEEDHKNPGKVYYKSKNDALLRKVSASQRTGRHNKTVRVTIVLILLVIAVSCVALIHAFASSREPLNQPNGAIHTQATVIEAASVNRNTVYVEKGDTLWAIANKYAPRNVSIRSYINKLMTINELNQPILQIGQVLLLP